MKLALFNDQRLGVVIENGSRVVDVTSVLPAHQTGFAANHWTRMCADFERLKGAITQHVATHASVPLSEVQLGAPVLNPSKIIAAAANYSAHVDESRPNLTEAQEASPWFLAFDVFLKAPSAIIGPGGTIVLPPGDLEVHHEAELALVIGSAGKNIPEARALDHVLGYTLLIDVTVRGDGDRARRKSYDGFCPIGPFVVSKDEIPDPHALEIRLEVGGDARQHTRAGDMTVHIPGIIAYASSIMTLLPGDVIATGSPPGVGAIKGGDRITAAIDGIGEMTIHVLSPDAT